MNEWAYYFCANFEKNLTFAPQVHITFAPKKKYYVCDVLQVNQVIYKTVKT